MNKLTKCYVITAEPAGVVYDELVRFCCSRAATMIVVVRDPEREPGASINEKLTRLASFRTDRVRAREWPGTVLLADQALVYRHRVAPGLELVLRQLESRLFDWLHPAAPEDLCFLREDDRPILVTTSHERDAYLLLTEQELRVLSETAPHLAAILKLEGEVSGD